MFNIRYYIAVLYIYASKWMGDRLGAVIVALEMASALCKPAHVTTGKPPLWVNRGGHFAADYC